MVEEHAGYRLDYLEFYNWGTFDGRTARISPACYSSLMTGANGSGKTTIVDALLTLLVPNQKRFYNQSSGAEQKKDRSEESYIRGEIGKTRDDDDLEATKKYLRPDKQNTFSFLLGCFRNPETDGYITLVQARWFSTTELKRIFIVSPHRLNINDHIMPFDKLGEWRKRLKNNFAKTEITDSFAQYSQEFIRLFNMRSDKALTLFNQTVGIKVLGNLNEFIRHHMLEDGEQEEEFQKLRANYLDLLETHTNLQKAEEQIRLLTPVVEACNTYDTIKNLLEQLENVKSAIPFYFSEQEIKVLEKLVSDTKGLLREQEELICEKEREKKTKEEELKAFQAAVDNNTASKAISQIEEQVKSLSSESDRKKEKSKAYNTIAAQLDYKELDSQQVFHTNRHQLEEDIKTVDEELEKNRGKEVNQAILKQKTEDEMVLHQAELQSLRTRKNRIPLQNIELRQRMLNALDLVADEIPFVGELIRVRVNEKSWESAIERLVRAFGLRLLVPEKHLNAVNQYVDATNLKGKIVYDRIYAHLKSKLNYQESLFSTLRDKLDIKPGEPLFESWLEQEFSEHLNYVCAENQQDFDRAKKALLISGLSKNGDRHEKDDRNERITPDRYILGWDNKEQIRLVEAKFANLANTLEQITTELKRLQSEANSLNNRKVLLQKLSYYELYNELNWQEDEKKIIVLSLRKEKLARESGLETLINQRDEAEQAVKILDGFIKEEAKKVGQLEERIKTYEKNIDDLKTLLESEFYEQAKGYYTLILPYIKEADFSDTLKKVQEERKQTMRDVEDQVKQKNREGESSLKTVIRYMAGFIAPSEVIRQQFPDWSKDTMNLSTNIDYADDFKKLHDRIVKEDLPRHKKTFRDYMKDSVTSRITSFKTGLDNRMEEIEEHILLLNKSLYKIDFDPNTYIELRSKLTKDTEVRDFRRELAACIVSTADLALSRTDDWVETAFINIKNLIEKLHNDKDKRKRLIDVRNWMDFEAEEFYRENKKRRRTLDSSDSLSGGEKAQFTYTVLGAAIAFQFGISESTAKTNSFRFIAVDEAFSKLDPEKSKYLMALCEQLHLQILVVTPLDKIYVAEPYISSCHFVEKQSTDRSKVYNLTMAEYREQKQQWQTKTMVN